MIYTLFFSLVLLFSICYLFSGRDIFAPATIQILTFAGSVFMCIYFMWSMNAPYVFHWNTIVIIMSAMILTAVIGIVVHHFFLRIEIREHTSDSVNVSPISSVVSIFFLGVIFLTIGWLLIEIRRIGGTAGTFSEMMNRFHAINSYSTEESGKLPFFLNQLLSIMRVLPLIYSFNLIRFYDILSFGQKCVNFLILGLSCINLLLTGSRTSVMNPLLGCFIMFCLLRAQREGKYKRYRFKSLIHVGLLLLLIVIAFYLTKNIVGRASRNEMMSLVDYISYYTGTQYIVFDQYLQRPPNVNSIIGKETFYSLNQFLINYKLIDIPSYTVHLEFRPVGAGFTTNVYTFLRAYHHDFGLVGMIVLHGLSILLLSSFYEFVKKKKGNLGILIFSQIYYTIVMSFFAERFYSNIFSMNYIKLLVMMIILYEFFVRRRVRLVFRRTAAGQQKITDYRGTATFGS